MAKTSDEVSTYINSPSVSSLLQNLTANCGKTIDVDNLWVVTDSFLIEVRRHLGEITERGSV